MSPTQPLAGAHESMAPDQRLYLLVAAADQHVPDDPDDGWRQTAIDESEGPDEMNEPDAPNGATPSSASA